MEGRKVVEGATELVQAQTVAFEKISCIYTVTGRVTEVPIKISVNYP